MLDTGQVIYYRNYDTYYICNIIYCTKYHLFVYSLFSGKRYEKGYTITQKTMVYNIRHTYDNHAMCHCMVQLCIL